MPEFMMSQDWLAARAAATPLTLALIEEESEFTYAELDRLVDSACRVLVAEGVQAGSHVAVLLPNCVALVVLIHALSRLGVVLVPLNTRLTAGELAAQIERADCGHLVTTEATVASKSGLSAAVQKVVIVSDDTGSFAADQIVADRREHVHSRDGLQAIVFTSGTSGAPKGAMLTYANHFHSAVASAFRLGVLPNDRWLASLPLYHVGGLAVVLRACLYGTAVVLLPDTEGSTIFATILKHRVTVASFVPTMLGRLLRSPHSGVLASLRVVLLGGAAASADLLAQAADAGVPVATTYGLTEATSQVATMLPADTGRKPGSIGHPLMFTSVRIVDEAGEAVAAGTIGEICVRGPSVFAGYYNDTAATAIALKGGELHTGDLGYLDGDGDLWVVQRRSDLIVTGGENVYPAEVEQVLARHPAVDEACVVGLPDPEWGQRVGAMVTLHLPISEEELRTFARQHLAGYKIPRVICFVNNLPVNGAGKISRAAVVDALKSSGMVSV